MCLAFMKVYSIKLRCLRHNEKRRFSECNTHSAHRSQEKQGKIVENLFDKFEQTEGEHASQRQTSEKFPYLASFYSDSLLVKAVIVLKQLTRYFNGRQRQPEFK